MSKVIMTAAQLVERLEVLANRKTFYKNKYPYNLCYIHADGRTSADCVNLYKALLNGYDVTKTNVVGYFQKDLSNTGDCTEYGLLKQCSEITDNFGNMGNKPRLIYMKGHIGGYIGKEVTKNGKVYNCIECTGAWGGGIIYSYIDADGTRRQCRGGAKGGKWTKNGLMTPWVDYSALSTPSSEPAKPTPAPAPQPSDTTYTVKKGDTLGSIAVKYGISLTDLKALNPQITDPNKIFPGQKINVSANAVSKPEYYVVQSGDTAKVIAKKCGITYSQLQKLNPQQKNWNLIYPGQKFRIK